jgi:hypothetical protein
LGQTPPSRFLDSAGSGNTLNTVPLFSFKVSEDEARLIRAKARSAKEPSVSSYLRKSALGGEASTPAVIARKKHPISGLPYNAAEGRSATDEQIRAALAEFP